MHNRTQIFVSGGGIHPSFWDSQKDGWIGPGANKKKKEEEGEEKQTQYSLVLSEQCMSRVWRLIMKANNLSMKEGSLFCFVVMRFTVPRCFRSCSWCLWKALDEEGWCMGVVPWCDLDLQWFLNIEWFLH